MIFSFCTAKYITNVFDYERIKSVTKQSGSVINTRYYFGDGFEKDVTGGTTRYIQYISSPAGLVAIVESQGSSHAIHYTYTDHLGSLVTVTDGSAAVETQQSFDAWGRRRIFDTWALLAPTAGVPNIQAWLYRGYTGHEHLDQFGLINMNGRLYDPVLARMLSPDNFVADKGLTQDYNRYTYARNNPLIYTDPDGEWIFLIPQISFGKGGFSLGLEIGVGIPGALSASLTGGYNFGNGAGYWSIQGSAVGLYAGYGSSGAFGGYGYRYAGFSAGIGYGSGGWNAGISYGGTAGNFNGAFGIGWSQKGGFDWNVNGGYTHNIVAYKGLPDNLTANSENSLGTGGEMNVPGGEWDFWGEGYVKYQGEAMGGTNFIGPGSDEDPFHMPDPNNKGKFLSPVDAIDKAAQIHDKTYLTAKTGGIPGALFNKSVTLADTRLALRANKIMAQYGLGNVNISPRTANLAAAVFAAFVPITISKAVRVWTYTH